jgi:hypothetical protein
MPFCIVIHPEHGITSVRRNGLRLVGKGYREHIGGAQTGAGRTHAREEDNTNRLVGIRVHIDLLHCGSEAGNLHDQVITADANVRGNLPLLSVLKSLPLLLGKSIIST